MARWKTFTTFVPSAAEIDYKYFPLIESIPRNIRYWFLTKQTDLMLRMI